jgi:hypothetical protein
VKKALVVIASVLAGACGGHEPTPTATVAAPRLTATLATAEKLEAGARLAVQGTLTAEKVTAVSSRVLALVTAAALVEQGGLTLVVVRGTDGRAETRVVTLGERLPDGRVEVLSGLSGGERVAVGLGAAPAAGTVLEEGVS